MKYESAVRGERGPPVWTHPPIPNDFRTSRPVLSVAPARYETTAEHPFYVAGRGYVDAGDLRPGDELFDENGYRSRFVGAASSTPAEPKNVYNFAVADRHNYFVAAPGSTETLLVHNMEDCGLYKDDWARSQGLTIVSPRSGIVAAATDHEHHIYPRHRRKEFLNKYGINVDDFVVKVDQTTHEALHAGKKPLDNKAGWWDRLLMETIDDAEKRLGRYLTPEELHELSHKLLERMGLDEIPIGPYSR